MQPIKCRPLIRPEYELSHKYINLQYSYTLETIQELILYLPLCVKFIGVDFLQQIPITSLQKYKKIRNKLIGLRGAQIKSGEKFSFFPFDEYEWICWKIDIVTQIFKEDLTKNMNIREKLNESLNKNIFICSQKHYLEKQNLLSVSDLKKCSIKSSLFKLDPYRNNNLYVYKQESNKFYRGCISTGLLIKKQDCLTVESLKSLITSDLSLVLYTFHKNELLFRDLRLINGVLPIQNFLKKQGFEKDQYFQKFYTKISNKQSNEANQNKQISGSFKQQNNLKIKTNNSIYLLGFTAILIIFMYAYIKYRLITEQSESNL